MPNGINPRHSTPVREIMTRRIVTVDMDDPLSTVKEIFDRAGFHHLLVVGTDNALCGVISDRDLLRALGPYLGTLSETHRDTDGLKRRAHQIMSRQLITLKSDAIVSEATQLFLEHTLSCLPIVDDAFKPVGILSWRDVLQHVASL
jgi:acetoin utilization protein AcuB